MELTPSKFVESPISARHNKGTPNGGSNSGKAFLAGLVTRGYQQDLFGSVLSNCPAPGTGTKSPANGTGGRLPYNYQPSFTPRSSNQAQAPMTGAATTPRQRGMGTSCPQASPERILMQMSYLEKKCDDVLDKVVTENAKILAAVTSIKDSLAVDIRSLKSSVESLTTNVEKSSACKKCPASGTLKPGEVTDSDIKDSLAIDIRSLKSSVELLTTKLEKSSACKKCTACGTLKPVEVTDSDAPTAIVEGKSLKPFTFGLAPPTATVKTLEITSPPKTTAPITTTSVASTTGTPTTKVFSEFTFGLSTASGGAPFVGFGDVTSSTPSFSKPLNFKGFEGAGKPLFSQLASNGQTSESSIPRRRQSSEGEGGDVEEFVPTQEFAPVIPLPPLVETTMGDENENTLFENRAKIYRFDSSAKEWKERGVGNIKILQGKDNPGAVRIVMWREKVGKLACNHWITSDMKVENYQQNPKVLKWTAVDHAEGEPRPEIFTCRFGNEEKCSEFKTRYEEMVGVVGKASPIKTAVKAPAITSEKPPLSELFKKDKDSWDCSGCYINNPSTCKKCPACSTLKPGDVTDSDATTVTVEGKSLTPFTFGFAPSTITVQTLEITSPPKTTAPITTTSVASTTGTPTTNIFSQFTFGLSAASAGAPFVGFGDVTSSTPSFSKPLNFKGFEGAGKPLFSQPASNGQTSESSIPRRRQSSEGEGGDVEEFVPTQEFAPVIPLPPLVETTMGDENENTLFENRAKIYRFDSSTKEWKERGVGNIKILQGKDNPGAVRIVMWREKVGKLACNHWITSDMKVENYQQNPKVLKWTAVDHAEDQPRPEIFTCRFGNEEKCSEFKTKYEEMVGVVGKASPIKTAVKAPAITSEKPPLSELFKKDKDSWDCSGCYINNPSTCKKCPACSTLKPGEVTDSDATTSVDVGKQNPPMFNFAAPTTAATLDNTTGITPSAAIATTSAASTTTVAPNLFSNFSFGLSAASTAAPFTGFGDVASSTSSFSKPLDFKGFEGAGKPLFSQPVDEKGESSLARRRQSSEGEGGDVEEFVPTQEFAPVIPLPPLVETTMGDENENTLFENRAKIYRFDSSAKEWKERGVGNIKILQGKDNPGAVRIVMWREKVGKLACNHWITSDMKVENYQQNPKVLKWTAVDHAEGEPRPEIFTCRFGHEEKCSEFKTTYEKMVGVVGIASPIKAAVKAPAITSEKPPLSELFKKDKDSWDCSGCYINNPSACKKCPACSTLQPGCQEESEDKPPATAAQTFSFGFNPLATTSSSKSMPTAVSTLEAPSAVPAEWASFDASRFSSVN